MGEHTKRKSAWACVKGGLLAATLALLPLAAFGAGAGAGTGKVRQKAKAAEATFAPAGGQHRISPHAKASRERAVAAKSEHRPKLRLGVRGAQKASGR